MNFDALRMQGPLMYMYGTGCGNFLEYLWDENSPLDSLYVKFETIL